MLINHGFFECFGKVESGIAMGFRWIPSGIADYGINGSKFTVGFRCNPSGIPDSGRVVHRN